MVRKILVVVFLSSLFLSFSLSYSSPGFEEGQQVIELQMQRVAFGRPFDIQKVIEVLKAINEIGLTDAQLQELQNTVQGLLMARATKEEAQDDLMRFLLEFKGGEFAKEFAPYLETLKTAESNLEAKLEEAVTKIEEMLTLEQKKILLRYFLQHYFKDFLISNLELLDYSVGCKLKPERCVKPKEQK